MTKEMLNNQVKTLNAYATAKYALYWAYGKVQLVRVYDRGGQSGVTGFCSKKELSDILGALITYSAMEKSVELY